MVKKVCTVLVFLIMMLLCSVAVFAGSEDKAYDADTKATKEKYVSIIKPGDGKTVTTYSKSYTISARSKQDDVVVSLYRFNDDKKQYEKITIEDESSWKLEKSGITFAKLIGLKEGSNVIMLVSRSGSDDKDEQRSIFEIIFNKKSAWEEIKDGLGDTIKSIFGKD